VSNKQNTNSTVGSPDFVGDELQRLQMLFERAPGFMAVVLGPNHIFKLINPAYQRLLGPREALGRPAHEVLPELVDQGIISLANQAYESGEPFVGQQMPVRVHTSVEGSLPLRYLDFVLQPLTDASGKPYGLFIQGQDVTDRQTAQEALRVNNERWKFTIEGAKDGIWDWDLQNDAVFVSSRYKEILGYAADAVLNVFDSWSADIHPNDRHAVQAALTSTLEDGTPSQAEYRLRCQDGSYLWVMARANVVARDEHGRPLRLTGTLTDIAHKKHTEEALQHHSNVDHLTGLPNRRRFRDQLHKALQATQGGAPLALLLLDLDHFKEVNDLRGQDTGDRLLIQVAERLKSCLPRSGVVARLGGDEFAVLLPELPEKAAAEHIAREIIVKLAAPFRLGGDMTYISASVGITVFPHDSQSPEELMRNADQALHEAKRAGRNQYEVFTPAMRAAAQDRIQLVQDLRGALTNNQLHLHYQPIVELGSGKIVKAESLLRWAHPTHGLVEPSRFIPLAEEFGLIHEIGNWVFAEAAVWSHRWSERLGSPFQLSVNCSPLQFLEQPEDWLRVLANKGIPPEHIALEITEGVLLGASPQISELLSRYKKAGMQVALDDFGTGYCSLRYLMQFDIDYLKIDRSFVRDLTRNKAGQAIVESIITMAHRLGLRVIAEGVEEPEQEAFLRNSGCDYGQGYLFSRPVPAHRMENLLLKQNV
jgi:diguanylate cyclase (GGDEF)-like protein/PAS domain S-box-containing protein